MRNVFLAAATVAGSLALPAQAEEDSSTVVRAMEGAISCVLAAGKNGADTSRFDGNANWDKQDDGSYIAAEGLPVRVTFPADPDGIVRICVVEATLSSQDDQKHMRTAFAVLLKQEPFDQEDNYIWMFGKAGETRGLQFYTDATSEQPKVRLIGAAF